MKVLIATGLVIIICLLLFYTACEFFSMLIIRSIFLPYELEHKKKTSSRREILKRFRTKETQR